MRAREFILESRNADLMKLRGALIAAAQQCYDDWVLDDDGYDFEVGAGGICHLIADEFVDILNSNGYEAVSVNSQIGENHVWSVVKMDDGVWEVDIPPYCYETGGGYTWEKIPDIKFDVDDVVINMLSSDPEDFRDYLEDY